MGSPAELTLGPQVPTISSATKAAFDSSPPFVKDQLDRMQKIEEHLRALKEERGKIEAFKRELPLCMQILDEAIETAKQRMTDNYPSSPPSLQISVLDERDSDTEGSKRKPVLEEFMPLKRRWERQQKERGECDGDQVSEQSPQKTVVIGQPAWMAEAQLWTQQSEQRNKSHETESSPEDTAGHLNLRRIQQAQSSVTSSRLLLSSKQRQGGAFLPFNRDRQVTAPFSSQSIGGAPSGPDLSLSSAERTPSPNSRAFGDSEVASVDVNVRVRDHGLDTQMLGPAPNAYSAHMGSGGGSQSQRKARRCWSPELHRRFVSALQQLGGSQVATPKQIRELMKVDGLTNDEVKSHLQKYRLHTRRPSPSPQSPSPQAPHLVVLGWVRPEFATAGGVASQASTGGVCEAPAPAIPQEYFVAGGKPQIHPPPVFEKHPPAVSISQTSPQGPLPVTGTSRRPSSETELDETDDEEEGKSVSSGRRGRRSEEGDHPLQSARESKGSSTALADADTDTTHHKERNSSALKSHVPKKIKATT